MTECTKAKLLPHERALLARGDLRDVTHARASSVWLRARSSSVAAAEHSSSAATTTVYRPMGDGEARHLVAHGVLPATQPYQAIIEGERGRVYAEKYLSTCSAARRSTRARRPSSNSSLRAR